ncbi:protein translocase subunit SecD [Cocleimonas flava]|uniref:Protein translocase subunit SecD n=1 Tax=Cocleimonas flava TaxID=634765 RepID=A0A4R1F257_9GAMM|nr:MULTISPECIES: protein translocase subunit SecD [Cocleimonas]MEB8434100.1 protein translocase subunit SecD [Cocleimonas sp. KMM 6892]MEC4717040.1 protein translocase subunit SecD [Cocleimonas sp. KMM 6895]MEC4746372.1 protein translocase subunit SecD [Cocleimonas sp. KMM 6896]TCJ88206.1 preprotein translocase subunit SecD [Cocleimonas flava]
MNRYPMWKYIIIIVVMLGGLILALPNIYPSQPAVQVTSSSPDFPLDASVLQQIKDTLTENGIAVEDTQSIDNSKALIRFDSPDTQLAAADAIKTSLGSKYNTALNLAPATPNWLRSLKPMNLGLDLRGGVHFLMEVDMKSAIDKSLTRHSEEFRTFLREKKISYLGVKRVADDLIIQFKTAELRDQARREIRGEYRNEIDFEDEETAKGAALKATLTQNNINNTKRFALQQNITTLRKRVNELGVSEPIIQQQGLERIVVQLPGVQDPSVAKEILGTTATLEFRLVDEGNDPYSAQASGRIPVGDKLFVERNGNPILLKSRVMLTGDYITDASSGFDQRDQRPSVTIVLDGKGAKLFAKSTGANVQKLMGVVFIEHKTVVTKQDDGTFTKNTKVSREVINVARIQEQLSKRFQITGLDTPQEAYNLALLLRAGALAAPVYIVEERTIGPSLGADNISAGFKSVIIGFVLVLIFMAFYYRVFGLVANLALTLNLVLIVAALSMLQATLTLPGIAGIVLTVGMAVDANVLIYERIKEELRNGLTPQAAIQSGYEKAFSTIADANITTLIAAIVLYGMGTGPIKGFAITLAIGIVSSMFTAIMGTRSVINLIYGGKKRLKKLHI